MVLETYQKPKDEESNGEFCWFVFFGSTVNACRALKRGERAEELNTLRL